MAVIDAPVLTTAAVPAPAATQTGNSWAANAGLVTALTIFISLGNYLYSFLVVHLTSAAEFSRFSAAQGLMVVLGSGSVAAIPWAMARFIAERSDRLARQQAMHFGLFATAVQGVVFAAVAGVVLGLEAGVAVGTMVAVSALIGSVSATPIGFLQGENRLPALAALRALEFIVRFTAGVVILFVVSRSAAAALIGYPIGAAVLVIAGLRVCRSGFPAVKGGSDTIRTLVRQSGGMGGIQVFITMLGALDTVAILAAHVGTERAASYQSAALLGRVPIFLSLSIGVAAYVHVVQAKTDVEVREKMHQAVALYAIVVVPILIALLTVPGVLLHLLIPSAYRDATVLLRFSVVSGVLVGWTDVVSTAHQARGRFRSALVILGIAAIAQPIVLIVAGQTAGIWVFASALVAVSLCAAVALSFDARDWLTVRPPLRTAGLVIAALAGAILLRGTPLAWLGLIAVISGVTVRALLTEIRQTSTPGDPARDRLDPEDDAELEPEPVAGPRVIILGDSVAAPLGTFGVSFGRLAAEALGADAVLDMAGLGKTVQDRLADAEEIRAFAPDLAILACGSSESLMHPGPWVKWILERVSPDTWNGVTGLEPRPYFSGNWRSRLSQRISSFLKCTVKRVTIPLGGGRRLSVEDFRESLDALLELLEGMGCVMVFVGLTATDDQFHPYTRKSLELTQAQIAAALAERADVALIDMWHLAHYWDDFLRDRLHYSLDGHRHVAGYAIAAGRELLGDRLPTSVSVASG